jgi:phage shock protein A
MSKIATAFRGSVRESAEVIIDANSLRIFAQEIHECENHVTQTKHQLASIIAEKSRVEREVDIIQTSIEQYETRMAKLLQQDDEVSALKLAEQVSIKEAFLQRNQKHAEQLQNHQDQLQQTMHKMISRLDNFRSEYRMAKSTGRMQNAQSKLASHSSGSLSRFGDMQDSLDRIREKQQQFSDEMNAMDQINAALSGQQENDDIVLKASANEILNRVKSNNKEV